MMSLLRAASVLAGVSFAFPALAQAPQGLLETIKRQTVLTSTITSPRINGSWGNLANVDRGGTATLFVSNTGFGVEAPGQDPVEQATVLRIGRSHRN